MRFVDTNVLLYAVSEVPEEAGKRAQAREVLAEPDLAASIQVLQEFFYQATRPTRARSLSAYSALQFLEPILLFRIQTMTMGVFLEAIAISQRSSCPTGTAQFSPQPAPWVAMSRIPKI